MTKDEAVKLICAKIAEVFDNEFPCICGDNPASGSLGWSDEEKLQSVLDAIDLLKE